MSKLLHSVTNFTIALILLLAGLAHGEQSLLQKRLERWKQQSLTTTHFNQADNTLSSFQPLAKTTTSLFADVKVNNDNGTSGLNQQYGDIAFFPDGKGIAVWEDERNGEWDIYAQLLNADGTPNGTNVRLIFNPAHLSQRQPRIAVCQSGKVAIVWSEEETSTIYAELFNSSLTATSSQFRLNDNIPANTINLPAVSSYATNKFVAVWEDSRNGANIYGEIFTDAGVLVGSNFLANTFTSSPYRLAPAISAGDGNNFAVVWEDARDGEGDVYFRIFNEAGAGLFPELKLEQNFEASYQFNPQVAFLKGNAYLAGWISNRNGGQSVYGQLISTSSAVVDTNFRINASLSDVCWDLKLEPSSDSGAGAVFTNYASTAEINFQKFTKAGAFSGTTKVLQDNTAMGERSFPALAFRTSGASIIWTDNRSYNFDIYQQLLDATLTKSGVNVKLNGDQNGSQQFAPDIAKQTTGAAAVVWEDHRDDPGDIYLQRITSSGVLTGAVLKLNDDNGKSAQSNPRIGSAQNGDLVVVWEDSRTAPGVSGQNIYCQRVAAGGTKSGANFIVNDDGTSNPKSQPDIAVGQDGKFFVVWVDGRHGGKEIYMARYNSAGAVIGANQAIPAAVGATECFNPHIGCRNDGTFVVSFISIVNGKQVLQYQRYNSAGVVAGSLQMLDIDTSQVAVLDADIFVHDTYGDFFLVASLQSSTTSNIQMFRYNSGGSLLVGSNVVSDNVNGAFKDLRISGDVNNGMAVTWSDTRTGIRRSFFQLLRTDGFHIGSNSPIHSGASTALEQQPASILNGGFLICTWIDNRNAGLGYDLFINSDQYTQTDVSDGGVTPPKQFNLDQNFPNPFNPETTIRFSLSKSQAVKLTIYNSIGEQVKVVVDEPMSAGVHAVRWDGTNSSGNQVASGIYFYRLSSSEFSETKKMTLLK